MPRGRARSTQRRVCARHAALRADHRQSAVPRCQRLRGPEPHRQWRAAAAHAARRALPARARAHRAARAGAGARRSLPDGAGAAAGPGGVRAHRGARAVDHRGRRVHAHAVRASHRRVAARAAVGQVAEAAPGRGRGGVGAAGGVVAADRHRSERAARGAAAAPPARAGVRGGSAGAGARGRRDRGAEAGRRRAARRQQRARAHARGGANNAGDHADTHADDGKCGRNKRLPPARLAQPRQLRARGLLGRGIPEVAFSCSHAAEAKSAHCDRAPPSPMSRRPRHRRRQLRRPRRRPFPRDRMRSRAGIPIPRFRRGSADFSCADNETAKAPRAPRAPRLFRSPPPVCGGRVRERGPWVVAAQSVCRFTHGERPVEHCSSQGLPSPNPPPADGGEGTGDHARARERCPDIGARRPSAR